MMRYSDEIPSISRWLRFNVRLVKTQAFAVIKPLIDPIGNVETDKEKISVRLSS